ncbi:unnamed protein product, partial [Ectocarpus sp. 4 AP-2014]
APGTQLRKSSRLSRQWVARRVGCMVWNVYLDLFVGQRAGPRLVMSALLKGVLNCRVRRGRNFCTKGVVLVVLCVVSGRSAGYLSIGLSATHYPGFQTNRSSNRTRFGLASCPRNSKNRRQFFRRIVRTNDLQQH